MADERLLDLGATWHVLHFLLTGTPEDAPLPRGFVLGGAPIGEDLGAGPARWLSPEELVSVTGALALVAPEQLQLRFDPELLGAHEVYAFDLRGQSDAELQAAWGRVRERYLALRGFLERGVRRGCGCVSLVL